MEERYMDGESISAGFWNSKGKPLIHSKKRITLIHGPCSLCVPPVMDR